MSTTPVRGITPSVSSSTPLTDLQDEPVLQPGTAAPLPNPRVAAAAVNPTRPWRSLNLQQPGYNTGAIPRATQASTTLTHGVEAVAYAAAFTSEERAVIDAVMAKDEKTAADLAQVAALIDSAEKAAAFGTQYLTWVDTHTDITTYSPQALFATGEGVCRDQHLFASYVLQQAGVEAWAVSYVSPDVSHAILVYREADGSWSVLEYGNVHHVRAATPIEALSAVVPDAMRFWRYGDVTGPGDSATNGSYVWWTDTGLQLSRFMHHEDQDVRRELERLTSTSAAAVRVSSDGQQISSTVGRLTVEARRFDGENAAVADAAGLAVRYNVAPGVYANVGVAHLPNLFQMSVGPREYVNTPETMIFGALEASGQLADLAVTPRLHAYVDYDVRAGGALMVAHAGQEGPLDWASAQGVSHLDAAARSELRYYAGRGLSVWASATAHLPVETSVYALASGGTLAETPLTTFAEGGVSFDGTCVDADARVYAPISVRSNLVDEDFAWGVTAAAQVGKYGALLLDVDGRFDAQVIDGVGAGGRLGPVTLTGTVQELDAATPDLRAQGEIDLAAVFRRKRQQGR